MGAANILDARIYVKIVVKGMSHKGGASMIFKAVCLPLSKEYPCDLTHDSHAATGSC